MQTQRVAVKCSVLPQLPAPPAVRDGHVCDAAQSGDQPRDGGHSQLPQCCLCGSSCCRCACTCTQPTRLITHHASSTAVWQVTLHALGMVSVLPLPAACLAASLLLAQAGLYWMTTRLCALWAVMHPHPPADVRQFDWAKVGPHGGLTLPHSTHRCGWRFSSRMRCCRGCFCGCFCAPRWNGRGCGTPNATGAWSACSTRDC